MNYQRLFDDVLTLAKRKWTFLEKFDLQIMPISEYAKFETPEAREDNDDTPSPFLFLNLHGREKTSKQYIIFYDDSFVSNLGFDENE